MTAPQLHLRPAIASDLDAVLALERATGLAPHWPPTAYAAILQSAAPGAPFIPRPLRNEWETEAYSSGQIGSDGPQQISVTHRCLFVAEKDNSLAGFAVGLLHPGASDRIAELESVVVSVNFRRAGIGRALCRAVLDWAHTHGATEAVLEVRAGSAAAIALYASLGFTLTARRPRYYRDPSDDALLMRLPLQPNGGRIDD